MRMSDLKYPWALSSHSERLEVEKGGWVSCSLGLGRWGIGTGGKGNSSQGARVGAHCEG